MTVADTRLAIVITACTFSRCGRSSILYGNTQGINWATLKGRIRGVSKR
jgi:hypothetical protein